MYLAFDPKLNRNVALKVPHPESLFDPELRRRFLREAHVAAAISHPNIVPVYEVGEAGPICFIAAAFCEGPTLADWLAARQRPLDFRTAATLIMRLAEAVEHAHRCDVLHRDLKPGNVLLDPCSCVTSGRRTSQSSSPTSESCCCPNGFVPKLTDFGLAKSLETDTSVTRTGAVLGTAAYMSPEQADGRQEEVGPSTDVYALGVILYELLTQQMPFENDSDVRKLRQIVFDEPVPPRHLRSNIPRELEAICLKCLEKRPQARYARAADLAADLHCFLAGRPTTARPSNAMRRFQKWIRRRPAAASLVTVSVLFPLIVFVISWSFRSSLSQVQEDAVKAGHVAKQLRQATSQQRRLQDRHEYVDHVHDAFMAWSNAHVDSAMKLLERCQPAPGEEDERGFEWYFVRRLCEGGLQTMHGHQELPIHSASFSADGTRLATGGEDNSIHIWDASSGKLLAEFRAHAGCVRDVGFSSDGRYLVSVGDDGKLKVWDARTYALRRVIEPGTGKLCCLAMDQAAGTIAVAGDGGKITLWNLKDGRQELVISADCGAIHALDYSTDGKLAAACDDQTALVWDIRSPNRPIRVMNSVDTIHSVAFSPDCQSLATGGDFVHLWPLDSDRPPMFLPGHNNVVFSVAFSPDGQLMATTGGDRVIRIWDVATGQTRHRYLAHTRPIFDLAFSPDGKRLASSDKGGTIQLWNPKSEQGRCPFPIDFRVNDLRVAFSPKDETLAVAHHGDPPVSLWRASVSGDVELLHEYSSDSQNLPPMQCIQWIEYSPNGRYLAVASVTGQVLLDRELRPVRTHRESRVPVPTAHQLAFSTGGLVAESAAGDVGKVSITEAESGRPVLNLDGYRGIAFSPDGKWLAVESAKSLFAIELWDIEHGQSVALIPGHTGQIFSMAFSANGRFLVSGSADGSVRLWDAIHHREIRTMRGHTDGIQQVAFCPDQKCVVSSGVDGTVRFWDVLTGRPMLELPVTSGAMRSISFSSDGQILATACLAGRGRMIGQVDLWCAPR